jgi:hypothetical protein
MHEPFSLYSLVHYPQWLLIYLADHFRQHAPWTREQWLDEQAWRSALDALGLVLVLNNRATRVDDIFGVVDQMAKPTIGELKRVLALDEFHHLLEAIALNEAECARLRELVPPFGRANWLEECEARMERLGDEERIPASVPLWHQETLTGWARAKVVARSKDPGERFQEASRMRFGVYFWMVKLAREVSVKVLADRVQHLETTLPEAKPAARVRF